MKKLRGLAFVVAAAAPAAGCYATATGEVGGEVIVEAPPPPVIEVEASTARPGYVWISGHHVYQHGHYVWHRGYYERERSGHIWVPGHWDRRGRGHVWIEGHWRRR
jgi:hypothetical protein